MNINYTPEQGKACLEIENAELRKENQGLKERIDFYEDIESDRLAYIDELEKENQRLNNVLNELENWLKVNLIDLQKQNASNIYNEGLKQGMLANGRLIQDKLNELKESDK